MNQFTDRRYVFIVAIVLVGLVFILRLFQLQVLDKSYEQYALSNAQSVRVIYPARGLISIESICAFTQYSFAF